MFISIEKIIKDVFRKKEIIDTSNFVGVETDKIGDCDIIVISHFGYRLFKALPAYYTDDTKKEIIVNDPRRTFRENIENKIELVSCKYNKTKFLNVHEIDGYKFTMITVNILEVRSSTGLKYWPKDNWL